MKPGSVNIVSCNLSLITNPIKIPSLIFPGARLMPVGGLGESGMCFKAKRWGSGKSGNVNNARWRRLQNKRKSAKNSPEKRR